MSQPRTLTEAIVYFADADNCLEYMKLKRWPDGVVTCPTCGNTHVRFDRKRRMWTCNTKHPKRQFSVKVGTVFEDSPLGLDKWLPAVWMIANMKNGISSHELARSLGVTQKSAWFMLHRIRLALQAENGGMISGDVEVDETYIGGKSRNMHADKRKAVGMRRGRSMAGKVAVMGLLDRHGKDGVSQVRTTVLKGRKSGTLQGEVRKHVAVGSNVYTDAFYSYRGLQGDFQHGFVDHAEAYVEGQVHTNGCENFWSLLKRGLKGTYVSVEPFHLFRYLDEQVFRFNHRKAMKDVDRFSLAVCGIVGRRLTYKDLLGAGRVPSGN